MRPYQQPFPNKNITRDSSTIQPLPLTQRFSSLIFSPLFPPSLIASKFPALCIRSSHLRFIRFWYSESSTSARWPIAARPALPSPTFRWSLRHTPCTAASPRYGIYMSVFSALNGKVQEHRSLVRQHCSFGQVRLRPQSDEQLHKADWWCRRRFLHPVCRETA